MMLDLDPFPDCEALVIAACAPAITNLLFTTDLPPKESDSWNTKDAIIRVRRITGAPGNIRVDHPVIDLDAFASSRMAASQAARDAQAFILGIRGQQFLTGGVIQSVSCNVGPRQLPEPNPNLFRFGATYRVNTHS